MAESSFVRGSVVTQRVDGRISSDYVIEAVDPNPVVKQAMYHAGATATGLIAQGHSHALALEAIERQRLGVYSRGELRALGE